MDARVIVTVEGGRVQGVSASRSDIRVTVVDFDTEGCASVTKIPHRMDASDNEFDEATVYDVDVELESPERLSSMCGESPQGGAA